MIRLYITVGYGAEEFYLEDFENNIQGKFTTLPELFRFVNQNFNSYELIVDSSIVNRY